MDMSSTMPVMPMSIGGNGGFFGGSGAGGDWFAFLILIFIFGWGGNGGMFGRNGASAFNSGELLADQFALQDLKNGINGISQGICQLGYEVGTQGSLTREAIANSAFGLERGLSNLSTQMSNGFCETNRSIDAVRYDMAKNTCDIITNANMNTRDLIQAGNINTQRIIDMMTQNEIQALRDKNNELAMSSLLQQQTATITGITNPRPIPAYPVCSPYEAVKPYGLC